MILTLNEEANIGRTLAKLTWAERILIVDSGSTDRTLEIVRQFPQAEVIRRDFDTAAVQCNCGLTSTSNGFSRSTPILCAQRCPSSGNRLATPG